MNTRQEIALAVGRGWTFLPCVRAEKDGTVRIGSDNADLLPRVVEFEREETARKDGVAEREHIDRLVERMYALASEWFEAMDKRRALYTPGGQEPPFPSDYAMKSASRKSSKGFRSVPRDAAGVEGHVSTRSPQRSRGVCGVS